MERKNFEGRSSRRPRKPQSWARTWENGNSIWGCCLGTAAGRFSQDQRTLSILRKPSVARSAATAINIINEQSTLTIVSTYPRSVRRRRGEVFLRLRNPLPRLFPGHFNALANICLQRNFRSDFSVILETAPLYFSTDASCDARSAAINVNNFGIFLTVKNISAIII